MKFRFTNYPLVILLIVGLIAISCETARRDSLNETRTIAEDVSNPLDTTANFFSRNLTDAQIDSVWRSKGY